jgi:hypothetical protein
MFVACQGEDDLRYRRTAGDKRQRRMCVYVTWRPASYAFANSRVAAVVAGHHGSQRIECVSCMTAGTAIEAEE